MLGWGLATAPGKASSAFAQAALAVNRHNLWGPWGPGSPAQAKLCPTCQVPMCGSGPGLLLWGQRGPLGHPGKGEQSNPG